MKMLYLKIKYIILFHLWCKLDDVTRYVQDQHLEPIYSIKNKKFLKWIDKYHTYEHNSSK